ncbi:MAG TPA: alpha/beta hydrolase [Clostridiaceae bacterium]
MIILKIFILIIIILLALLIVASLYFYDVSIKVGKKAFIDDEEDDEDPFVLDNRWLMAKDLEEVSINSHDGLKLCGYYLKSKEPSNKVAILVHGYTSEGRKNGGFARLYYQKLGYSILTPDDRGHGQSEGKYIGFGWHDRLDYLRWINYIIERNGRETQIVLHGLSMGGGIVLMVSGEKLPSNLKCIISDCAYTSMKEELSYQIKRMYRLPRLPLIQLTSIICRLRAGYYIGDASALKQVKKASVPILFIHGDADTFVPTKMVYELYEACMSEKKLLIIPKAGHAAAYYVEKEIYEKEVMNFVNKYVI